MLRKFWTFPVLPGSTVGEISFQRHAALLHQPVGDFLLEVSFTA